MSSLLGYFLEISVFVFTSVVLIGSLFFTIYELDNQMKALQGIVHQIYLESEKDELGAQLAAVQNEDSGIDQNND